MFTTDVEAEQPRRFHLFRHEEKALEAEVEPEVEVETGQERSPEDGIEEVEPPRRFHLLRHKEIEPELEPSVETPNRRDDAPGDAYPQGSPTEPGHVDETLEETVEIDLPPEIAVAEIAHTLEDLRRREFGLRRRRWPLGAGAGEGVAEQTVEDETADGESEVRLAAEQERRRREREYLRSLRVSR